ncbi:nucleotidyltransferase domain-containing protein [Clostridium polynesiense]|uniref:nucleotidyltransferase domain-containing protein n=1 Tax=Clostridium polynesiense TaxID=1325933 RepID=UPI00058D8C2D|nr:nucleotidyltransferase domain-containing protein [Clostridium polynesiense]
MNCKKILNKIAYEYKRVLGDNLIGIYVHGSLAFGCFNPNKSDMDFIVVINNLPTIDEKEEWIKIWRHILRL